MAENNFPGINCIDELIHRDIQLKIDFAFSFEWICLNSTRFGIIIDSVHRPISVGQIVRNCSNL